MTPLEIVYYSILICGMIGGVVLTGAIFHKQLRRMEMEFEIKMAAAKAQELSHKVKDFKDIRDDIEYIISFLVANEVPIVVKDLKEEDNKEQITEQLTSDISAKARGMLSEEMVRQISQYATIDDFEEDGVEDFLTYFIRKETLMKVMTIIDSVTVGR